MAVQANSSIHVQKRKSGMSFVSNESIGLRDSQSNKNRTMHKTIFSKDNLKSKKDLGKGSGVRASVAAVNKQNQTRNRSFI